MGGGSLATAGAPWTTFSTESASRRTVFSVSEGSETSQQQKGMYVMTEGSQSGPVLFCFDGSDGSREAMRAAADLIDRPVEAVVLTVWETVATRLTLAGAFAAGNTTGDADLDVAEESYAKSM